jgi:bifunctional non-homologous end joining protein LigD
MSVAVYNRRKDLPSSISISQQIKKTSPHKRIFVVQRHLGSILHYDLRIEINGILKSWAIPKGPSMNGGDRRLAVLAEDYPLSYANFQGIVPEGTYGAGILELWDKGTCVPHAIHSSGCPDQDLMCQFKEGRLKFTLKGKKLKGVFTLVRLDGGDQRHWLLIKGNDKFAVNDPYDCEKYIARHSRINKALRGGLSKSGNA